MFQEVFLEGLAQEDAALCEEILHVATQKWKLGIRKKDSFLGFGREHFFSMDPYFCIRRTPSKPKEAVVQTDA